MIASSMAVILVLNLIAAPTAAAASRFPDVPNWCAAAVSKMAEQGILSGDQHGTFRHFLNHCEGRGRISVLVLLSAMGSAMLAVAVDSC